VFPFVDRLFLVNKANNHIISFLSEDGHVSSSESFHAVRIVSSYWVVNCCAKIVASIFAIECILDLRGHIRVRLTLVGRYLSHDIFLDTGTCCAWICVAVSAVGAHSTTVLPTKFGRGIGTCSCPGLPAGSAILVT